MLGCSPFTALLGKRVKDLTFHQLFSSYWVSTASLFAAILHHLLSSIAITLLFSLPNLTHGNSSIHDFGDIFTVALKIPKLLVESGKKL